MAKPYSGPTFDSLRKTLSDLIKDGLSRGNIAAKGDELRRLAIVEGRLAPHDGTDEDEREVAYADAVVTVLKEAVVEERIYGRNHRRILKFVLPLKEKYTGTSIKERRTAAGEDIKTGKKPIKPSTIRTYFSYEPQALDELARVLVEMEAEYRDETPPDATSDKK
jgi:hypothetical protein